MDDLDELVTWGEYWLCQNVSDPPWRYTDQGLQEFGVYECYYGLCSGQAQREIDRDEKRMGPTNRNLMAAKVAQCIVSVSCMYSSMSTTPMHMTQRETVNAIVSARLVSSG